MDIDKDQACKIYFKVDQSVAVSNAKVTIEDVASVYCRKKEVAEKVKKLTLHQFIDDMDDREVFSTLKILEIIQKEYHDAEVENIGCSEFIVYYKRAGHNKKTATYIKIVLISLVCFFGAGFTMITYNTDTGVKDVLSNLQELFTGKVADGPSMLEIGYALGIIVGVIIFFNHTAKKRLSDEPTPLEVKMRLYEKDVNDSLITGSGRKGDTIDVD